MNQKIEIIRNKTVQKPVAYLSKGLGAVYFPGKDGKCISASGEETAVDYSNVGDHIWNNPESYEPLFAGDIIRLTKDIVL